MSRALTGDKVQSSASSRHQPNEQHLYAMETLKSTSGFQDDDSMHHQSSNITHQDKVSPRRTKSFSNASPSSKRRNRPSHLVPVYEAPVNK